MGSRNPGSSSFHIDCPVVSISECLGTSSLVILAIPCDAHADFAAQYEDLLTSNHVLVDISNSQVPGAAMRLQPKVKAQVIKSMNNLSAYFIEGHSQAHAPVIMTGSRQGKILLQERVLSYLGVVGADMGPLENSIRQEQSPFNLFNKWMLPLFCATIIWLFWFIYSLIWFHVLKYPREDGTKTVYFPWRNLPLNTMNKVFGMSCFTMFGLTYLPGVIAAVIQLVRGTAKHPFHWFLDTWMKMRKQMGLIAFWQLTVHMVMTSCILMSPSYFLYPVYLQADPDTADPRMDALGETSMLFAILSYATYLVVALVSVPSIASELSWREWNFCQSKLGLLGLIFGFAHVGLLNSNYSECIWCASWNKMWSYPGDVVPPGWVSIGVPGLVILLRFILALPIISHKLGKIRASS